MNKVSKAMMAAAVPLITVGMEGCGTFDDSFDISRHEVEVVPVTEIHEWPFYDFLENRPDRQHIIVDVINDDQFVCLPKTNPDGTASFDCKTQSDNDYSAFVRNDEPLRRLARDAIDLTSEDVSISYPALDRPRDTDNARYSDESFAEIEVRYFEQDGTEKTCSTVIDQANLTDENLLTIQQADVVRYEDNIRSNSIVFTADEEPFRVEC